MESWMRATTCLLIGLICLPAIADDSPIVLENSSKEFIKSSANLLGDCSGFFEFMSDAFNADNKPATAQQMHEMANGAMMAASYLLYLEYHTTANKRKRLGEFNHYPQGRADTNKTRLRALEEQRDIAGIAEEQKRCLAAVPMQNEIVQKIRDESVGRK
jgi:hypothetical protein